MLYFFSVHNCRSFLSCTSPKLVNKFIRNARFDMFILGIDGCDFAPHRYNYCRPVPDLAQVTIFVHSHAKQINHSCSI